VFSKAAMRQEEDDAQEGCNEKLASGNQTRWCERTGGRGCFSFTFAAWLLYLLVVASAGNFHGDAATCMLLTEKQEGPWSLEGRNGNKKQRP
jgi:hypothetical protein